jgi:5'-3' exonuclease
LCHALIVGDDADLILMALVSSTPRLHVFTSAAAAAPHFCDCIPGHAVIVGDDADLILMALVSSTPRLHILNSALGEEKNLSPQSAVLSVDKLHAVWQAGIMAGMWPCFG